MVKISGLDKLQRQLKEAQEAFGALDGKLGSVQFNPEDPASIESAVQKVEAMVDERAGAFESNPFVGPAIAEMKERYRQAILDRAASARLGAGDSDG